MHMEHLVFNEMDLSDTYLRSEDLLLGQPRLTWKNEFIRYANNGSVETSDFIIKQKFTAKRFLTFDDFQFDVNILSMLS